MYCQEAAFFSHLMNYFCETKSNADMVFMDSICDYAFFK